MLSKRLHTRLAALAVQLSPRSSLRDKEKKLGWGAWASRRFPQRWSCVPQLVVSAVVTLATPRSGHGASPLSRGCVAQPGGAALCSGRGGSRGSRGALGRGGWGIAVSVLHSPKPPPPRWPALCEVPRTHFSLNCWWTLALINARETTHFAFLETGMRNELPKEFGNEESERQFHASS